MFSAATIWILIPLAGIALGGFEQWLKFKKETRNSTSELDTAVSTLNRELTASREREAQLVERLENLETLVTSRLWNVVQDDPLPQSRPEAIRPEARSEPAAHATEAAEAADGGPRIPPPPPADPRREAELARARMQMRPAPGEPGPTEPDAREKARRMAQRLGV